MMLLVRKLLADPKICTLYALSRRGVAARRRVDPAPAGRSSLAASAAAGCSLLAPPPLLLGCSTGWWRRRRLLGSSAPPPLRPPSPVSTSPAPGRQRIVASPSPAQPPSLSAVASSHPRRGVATRQPPLSSAVPCRRRAVTARGLELQLLFQSDDKSTTD
uniref:Uncharacterized protein n=1 Tax=Oryza meridionalis TaxID=40149 RepID=A0A0E0EM11_9ORYZ